MIVAETLLLTVATPSEHLLVLQYYQKKEVGRTTQWPHRRALYVLYALHLSPTLATKAIKTATQLIAMVAEL